MSSLIVSGSGGGSVALERAQGAAAPGLEDLRRGAARRGQELAVDWTAVPDMNQRTHMVTVRLRLRPSGQGGVAVFAVTGQRVTPQDALARRLVSGMSREAPRPAGPGW